MTRASSNTRTGNPDRRPAGARRGLAALCAIAGLVAGEALAVDGRLEIRDTQQSGDIGAEDYFSRTRRQEGTFNQRLDLGGLAAFRLGFHTLFSQNDSRIGDAASRSDQNNHRANADLSFGNQRFRLGLSGDGTRREIEDGGLLLSTQDRLQYGGRATLDFGRLLRLNSSLRQNWSWQNPTGAPGIKTRQTVGSLSTESELPRFGNVRYSYSRRHNDVESRDTHSVDTGHSLMVSTNRDFLGKRGTIGLESRTHYFRQRTVVDAAPSENALLLPFASGYRIDSTPLEHDPLEDATATVAGLFDRDLDTPTEVAIGDNAPLGWQFGGDSRNIVYDFGEARSVSGAVIYLDRVLATPQFMRWDVYVSGDPEGQLWELLPPSAAQSVYREWSTGLQGYEIALSQEIETRHIKVVNVKLGPTEPELYVTEFEVFSRIDYQDEEDTSRTLTQRFEGTLSYEPFSGFTTAYNVTWRWRDRVDIADLEEQSHGVSANYRYGRWHLRGSYEYHRVGTREVANTRLNSRSLALTRRWRPGLKTVLDWWQGVDDSRDVEKTTNFLSLSGDWEAVSGLRFTQRVSYGWLEDRALGEESSSVTSNSQIRSIPFDWLVVNLLRTDRWIEREAGIGFTRFNDTTLSVTWSPWPVLSVRSDVLYQVRQESDFLMRNSVSWSPLPGGDVSFAFTASQIMNTRTDADQRGAGGSVRWRPRTNLLVEGGVDVQAFSTDTEERAPLNTFFRAQLRF